MTECEIDGGARTISSANRSCPGSEAKEEDIDISFISGNKSLIKRAYRNGARTEPWGTPAATGSQSPTLPRDIILNCRSERYAAKKCKSSP
jgi:hypothetical protein